MTNEQVNFIDYDKIIEDMPKELNQIEMVRYIYIQLGKYFSYDEKYITSESDEKKREIFDRDIEDIEYDKERFKKFILSKSNIQKAIRNNYKPVIDILENLDNTLDKIFRGQTLNALFSYKMKIGIK